MPWETGAELLSRGLPDTGQHNVLFNVFEMNAYTEMRSS